MAFSAAYAADLSSGRLCHRRLDLVAQEDPAPAELMSGEQPAPRVFEHRRDRQMQ